MSNSRIRKAAVAAALGLAFGAAAAATPPGAVLGREATPAEIQAWNIDVRPDFQGLPQGHGSVAEGEKLWTAKCASCHGDFADSNAVFPPLVGAFQATPAEMKSGIVPGLGAGGATSIEKLSTLSTLFDYIHRAMPWTAPLSLSWNDTYALVAYLMNLANVVPSNFVLTRDNVQSVQDKLPNRNDMVRLTGLWPGNEFGKQPGPDTHNTECMKRCAPAPKVESEIPEYAMDASGNLADQNRAWGPIRGQVTLSKKAKEALAKQQAAAASDPNAKVMDMLKAKGCLACHSTGDNTVVGPGYAAVAKKYAGNTGELPTLEAHIMKGVSGVWGSIPMPPQSVTEAEAKMIASWVVGGAKP